MKQVINQENKVRRNEIRADILVTGSSLEGCIAAIELANAGFRVLLTEQQGSLGETATNGLETYLPLCALSQGKPYEYAKRILKEAGQDQQIYGPFYDDQKLKTVLASMLKEAGVTVLTHIFVSEVIPGGDGKDSLCIIECKTGPINIYTKVILDANAFAGTSAAAGCPVADSTGLKRVRGSMKCSGISKQELQSNAKADLQEDADYLIGELNLSFTKKNETGISYTSEKIRFCHNNRFGETIFTGIEALSQDLTSFTLSEIQAGMRVFAYDLRNYLRKEEVFPQMSIIFVSPILNLYGARNVQIPDGIGIFRQHTEEYSNLWALNAGILLAEKAKDYLEGIS